MLATCIINDHYKHAMVGIFLWMTIDRTSQRHIELNSKVGLVLNGKTLWGLEVSMMGNLQCCGSNISITGKIVDQILITLALSTSMNA